jgi:hypothetical protein
MNCRSAEALYSSFLEDELSQKERRSFESHLLSCRRCSVAIRELRATLELIHELPRTETSPHFEEDVLARIRSGEAMRPSVSDWIRGWLEPARLRPAFLTGAAACAVWIAMLVAPRPDPTVTARHADGVPAPAPAAPDANVAAAGSAPAETGRPSGSAAGTAVATRETPAERPAGRARSGRSLPEEPEWAQASVAQDSALPNPGARYVDEYILDQFYIDRGPEGQNPSVTPVSDHPSDDVDIVF